jgi:hypothetical protein
MASLCHFALERWIGYFDETNKKKNKKKDKRQMKDKTAEKSETTSDVPTELLAEVEGKSQGVSLPVSLSLTKALSPQNKGKSASHQDLMPGKHTKETKDETNDTEENYKMKEFPAPLMCGIAIESWVHTNDTSSSNSTRCLAEIESELLEVSPPADSHSTTNDAKENFEIDDTEEIDTTSDVSTKHLAKVEGNSQGDHSLWIYPRLKPRRTTTTS